MGNLFIWKQSKDGSTHVEISALKPDSERITNLEGQFKPIYPGERRHHHQEPNDVKRILSTREAHPTEPEDENQSLDLVEQLTRLVKAQRAYEEELKKLKQAQAEHEQEWAKLAQID